MKNRRYIFVLLFLVMAISMACRFAGSGDAPFLAPGDHQFELDEGEILRRYIVHVPPQIKDGAPLPVVLNFHGGGGHAHGHQRYVRMDTLADQEGFLVVYPDGTGIFGRRLLTWNAGSCCGYARDQNIDDVAFVLAALEDLSQHTAVDMTRIYATGLSNGGMMAYRLAAEAGDRIAAIAPVAGAMVVKDFDPVSPVPVMHIHSVDDPRALYQGGIGPPFPFTNSRVTHPPLDDVLDIWARTNGCALQRTGGDVLVGAPGSQSAGHTAERLSYAACDPAALVLHWRLTGAGHVWPGGETDALESILGPSTDIIDANHEIWAFFSQFQIDNLE